MDKHKDMKKQVALAIRAYRMKNALTQEQLANKLGCSHMQIMRWEGAHTLPNRLSTRALQELKVLPPPTKD